MGSTYILRKDNATVSDLADGNSMALGVGDGEVFYVDPGNGNDANDGQKATTAFATLQAGIDACVDGRGDFIFRLPGGEEVTETVAFNKTGIYVKAVTYGVNPMASGELFSTYAGASFTDGPAGTITKRCTIDGLGFASRDTGATFWDGAALLIGGEADATPFGVHIKNCRFPKWGLDNRIGLAIEGSSDTIIEHCSFEGVGSALASGMYVQGATQNITIRDNHFRQCTSAVTFGAFAGGGPHVMYGPGNVVEDGLLITVSGTATGMIFDNYVETATDAATYSQTVNTLNGYGLNICGMNYFE